ncbi:Maf-like protein [Mycoavidus sp. B2-EB]|uniref:Maf-like protein n=1 Tax=Mycoavidus sp. B2-EB TaxID=2651972 RepID=UPI001624DA7D|nr:Maf-like protein [Mycoavidus sp. B2-EB]BBO59378.1 Maf-like protein [Mycoavidus sp. B2-EB]
MPAALPDQPRLILASSSPYRRALLDRLRIPFEMITPDLDETPWPNETPAATALRLAQAKARKVAIQAPDALIIGADQVALCEGQQLGKAGNHAKALAQLQSMRGRTIEFHSALCVYDAPRNIMQSADILTQVRLRDLPDEELDAYLRIEQPYDVAGSAKAEGLGIALLESVQSHDPTALIGLPLIELTQMLRATGLKLFTVR